MFESTARPLLLMEADRPRFTMVAVNRAHARAFRTTPEALVGRGVIEVFGEALPPEAQAFVDAIRTSLDKVLASGRSHRMGASRLASPGLGGGAEERFWSAVNSPVRNRVGRIAHIVSAAQDVTGEVLERRSEEARALLMREVDHRARNSLTVVQSLIRFAQADTVETFRDVLEGRVTALARAHASLAARRWEGAWLGEVLQGALAPLAETDRYSASGPFVMLPAEFVQPLSMITHELATNARKHGALSAPEGRLSIEWRLSPSRELSLSWRERCAGVVVAPSQHGFGSRLIDQLVRQVSGELRQDWTEHGLVVELTVGLRSATRRAERTDGAG